MSARHECCRTRVGGRRGEPVPPIIYEPLDLIAKLAALVPRPHKNLILYHGVLAANAAWRKRAVVYGRITPPYSEPTAPTTDRSQHKRRQWADLMRRAFGYDHR